MFTIAFAHSLPLQHNASLFHGSLRRSRTNTGCPLPQVAPTHRVRTDMLLDFIFKQPEPLDINELGKVHPAVSVTNLRKTFKKRVKRAGSKKKESRTITAVDSISFTVPQGKILGLLGPNSSGKTTTLRCMSTLCEPDSGTIQFYGVDAMKNPYIAREMIGFVAQSAGLDKVLTGREHLELFAALVHLDPKTRRRNIEAVIELFDLGNFIDRQAGVYSGGVVRRLDLAIAMLHQPPILILDEPTVGLDIETRRVIWDVIRSAREYGGTIVLTSHYLEEVDVLADEVAILEKGVVIAKGTTTELKNALGGDRVTIRLREFASILEADLALDTLKRMGLAQEGIINRLQNNALELVVDPNNSSIGQEIVVALRTVGFEKLFSFSQSKPSLDDVYLAATGQSLSDADSSAQQLRDKKAMQKESMA